MKYSALMTVMLAASLMTTSLASNSITFGDIGFGGNGCPDTTEPDKQASVILNESALHIIPQDFFLNSGSSERSMLRKKCDVALAVNVPDDYQIGISKVSTYAFLAQDEGSRAKIRLNAGFSGKLFTNKEAAFAEPMHQNLELSDDSIQWATCGANIIVRMKVSATLRAKKDKHSYLRVNSFGLNLEQRKCP